MNQRNANRHYHSIEVRFDGYCPLDSPLCDCEHHKRDWDQQLRRLDLNGKRVVLRGGAETSEQLGAFVDQARRRGYVERVLRTPAFGWDENNTTLATRALSLGLTGIVLPIFTHKHAVNDRIAGKPEALRRTLSGGRAAASAGLNVEVEIPMLSRRLQHLPKLLDLCMRELPQLRRCRFFTPNFAVHRTVAPPPWPTIAALLRTALELAERHGVDAFLSNDSYVPFCAIESTGNDWQRYFQAAKGRSHSPRRKPPACSDCPTTDRCHGPGEAYVEEHGSRGLRPLQRRSTRLTARPPGSNSGAWTDARRRAAKRTNLLVLRPTVACNQDCGFCSANESTANVWQDPGKMLRQIARAASRGVSRLSFSGGEPTLSPHLAAFVDTAHRCGIRQIELVTNGVLLDRPARVTMLSEAGLTHAFVSLHAHTEALSARITGQTGDFHRTTRAISLLVDAGIATVVNYVVCTTNLSYTADFVEFIASRYPGRVSINFAFVSPQFKALENFHLVPRLDDALPSLKHAMYRALALRQRFHVGARQGIPPCLLDEFVGFSDVFELGAESTSEDAFQKIRAPGCDECRFTHYCHGVWKPYAERHGLDELKPVQGAPFPVDLKLQQRDLGYPSFDTIPEELRRRDLERAPGATRNQAARSEVIHPVADHAPAGRRPIRCLLVGSGSEAKQLYRASRNVGVLSIDGVCSPHFDPAREAAFGHRPGFTSLEAALEGVRPDAVIIATTTTEHYNIARRCIERNLPLLIERPCTGDPAQARELETSAARAGVPIQAVHRFAHLDRLEAFDPADDELTLYYNTTTRSVRTPFVWSREALAPTLYELLALWLTSARRRTTVVRANVASTGSRPRVLELQLEGEASGTLRWQMDCSGTQLVLRTGRTSWTHNVRPATHDEDSADADRPDECLTRQLASFASAVRSPGPAPHVAVPPTAVLDLLVQAFGALETAGADLAPPLAPPRPKKRSRKLT